MFPGSTPKYQHQRDGLPGYDPRLEGVYAYDPAKATALLAEAGYADGVDLGDVLMPVTTPKAVGEAMQQQLETVGIGFNLMFIDAVEALTRWRKGESAGMLHTPSTGVEFGVRSEFRWGAAMNPGGTTPEFDQLLARAIDNRLTAEDRNLRYQAVNRYVVEQAWSAPILWVNFGSVMSDRVMHFDDRMDYITTWGPIRQTCAGY